MNAEQKWPSVRIAEGLLCLFQRRQASIVGWLLPVVLVAVDFGVEANLGDTTASPNLPQTLKLSNKP